MNERDLLLISVKAAMKAGETILGVYHSEKFDVETKADRSPLTIADKRSNKEILKYLGRTGIPVLSEESYHAGWDQRKEWHTCWIVDPLDGTKEFIKRNGEFTVNIALVEDGSPVLGVIFTPVTGELFVGSSEAGSFKKIIMGDDPSAATIDDLLQSATPLPDPAVVPEVFTVVASRSHRNEETDAFIRSLENKHPGLQLISRGSSLKICMVAEGKAQIYPRFAPTMEWDTAAGHAVAKYAGCHLYCPETHEELIYNKEKLTNPWFIVKREA